MADVQRDAESAGHGEHLLRGGADTGAFLPHMDGEGDVLPPQGLQRMDQLLRGAEALRCVAKSQRYAQRAVAQSTLHGAVDGAVVRFVQMLQLVTGGVRPQNARAYQHAGVQGQVPQRCQIGGQRR